MIRFNKIISSKLPVQNIFILLLIISGNYIGELFPCRIQDLLSKNVFIKHFIGLLTLIFFVNLTDTNLNLKFIELILSSLLLYFLFLLLINNEKNCFLFVTIILGTMYLLQLYKTDILNSNKIDDINEINKIDDENLQKSIINKLHIIDIFQKILFLIFLISLIMGFIVYLGQKKIEYKNKFDYLIFLFGKPSCKNKSPEVNFLTSIKASYT